jgi:hypothetical protein
LAEVRDGKLRVYIVGRSDYTTVFPDLGPRFTAFCVRMDPTLSAAHSPEECASYNDGN